MNPSVRNKKRQTILLLILLMSGIGFIITGYRWNTWPERTWNKFTRANREIDSKDRSFPKHCDHI